MKALFFAVVIGLTLLQASTTYAQTAQSAASSQVADPAITATGAIGEVKAIDAASKQMTVKTDAGSLVTVSLSDKTEMRRYATDSIKFSDAKPAGFTDLKVGDQLRALGDKSEDGLHFTPQKVVTGSFRTVAGTVTAVDAATGEIKITDLEKKQP